MDAIFALIAVGSLVLAFRQIGLWKLFWIGLAVYLGGFELAAKWLTGKTLSQQFWAHMTLHPMHGVVAGSTLLIGGMVLSLHLWWKQLTRKSDDSEGT